MLIPRRTVVTGVVRHGAFAGNRELAIAGQQVAQIFAAAAAGEDGIVVTVDAVHHIVFRMHRHPLIHGAAIDDVRLGAVLECRQADLGNGSGNVDGFQIGAVFEHSPSDVGDIFGQGHVDDAVLPAAPGNGALIGNVGHFTAAGQLQVAFDGQGVEMVVAVVAPGADGAVGADGLEYIFIDSGPLIHGAGKVQIRRGVAAEAGMTHKLQRSGQMDADHLLAVVEGPGADMGDTLGHGDLCQQTAVAENTAANGLHTVGDHKILQLGAVIEQVVRQVLDQIAGESHSLQCAAVGEDADAKLRYGGGNGHADQVGAVGECAVINGGQTFRQGNTGQAAAVGERTVTDGSQGAGQTDDRQIVAVIEGTDTDGGNTLADTDFLDHGPICVPGNTAAVSVVVHGTGADDPHDAILGQDIPCVFTADAALVDHVIGAVDLHIVGRICLHPLLHGAAEGDALQTGVLEGIACDAYDSGRNIQTRQAGTIVESLAADVLQTLGQANGSEARAAAEGRIRHLGDVGRQGDYTLGLIQSCPVFRFLQCHTVDSGIVAVFPVGTPALGLLLRLAVNGQLCAVVECLFADGFNGLRDIGKGQAVTAVEGAVADGADVFTDHDLGQGLLVVEGLTGDRRHRAIDDNDCLISVQLHPPLHIALGNAVDDGCGFVAGGIIPVGIPAVLLYAVYTVDGQIGTAVEGAVAVRGIGGDRYQCGGEVDHFQSSTVVECSGADGNNTLVEVHAAQAATATEGSGCDGGNGIGQVYGGQGNTAIERVLRNGIQTLRQFHIRQTAAVVEGAVSDGSDCVGDGNGGQAGAVFKGAVFNDGDRFGNDDSLDIGIALENACGDAGDARRDLDGFGGLVDGAPELTLVAHSVIVNGGLGVVSNVVPVGTPGGSRSFQRRKDGQIGTTIEGAGGLAASHNGGNGCGNVDRLQSGAVFECVIVDFLQSVGQGDAGQTAAAGESGTADLTQRIGQGHAGQSAAAAEGAALQDRNTAADLHLLQTCAAAEYGQTHIFGGCVEVYFFQICAVLEHIAANGGDGIGNGDGLQAFAAVERISLQFGDRFRNGQIGKRRTV